MSPASPIGADLSHIDTWLFDLDNTLYTLDSGLGLEIDKRITDYVVRVTGLPRLEAYALQKQYLGAHGLTLRGLMLNYGVDPDDFHAQFHDLSLETLAEDVALTSALRRLPGRRLVFTNADDVHARRVLQQLGLGDLFDEVFHIGSTDLIPKPDPVAFQKIIAAHAIDPATTAFFEDRQVNLEPAAALGMTTVLVGPDAEASDAPFVHYRAPNLASFLGAARLMES